MKTQNPWMGRARGSAGNMTSSKVYDKNVMRAKAFEVNNPNTAAQQSERNFFKQCQDAIAGVSEEQLRSLFPNMPKNKSRRNALMSQVLKQFSLINNAKQLNPSITNAFGNGKKLTMDYIDDFDSESTFELFPQVLSTLKTFPGYYEIYFVGYRQAQDKNPEFYITDTGYTIEDIGETTPMSDLGFTEDYLYNGYFTLAINQQEDVLLSFGQAKLYTRS